MAQEGSTATPDRLSSFILEMGTEEIPARFLPPALGMLRDNTASLLNDSLIGFSDIRTYATPRRLTVLVKGIPAMQRDRVKEVFGPSKKAAFDAQGNPTKAAAGFAQSQGVSVSDLVVRNKDKGEYVAAVIRQEGIAVRDLLPDVLKKIVLSLSFPKSMRWGSGSLRFARPLHWLLALFDGEPVPFDVDGVRSSNITKGHRFLSPGSLAIKEMSSYLHLLENNFVIADQDERMKRIEAGISALASSVGGRVPKDDELLQTVTYLVEYPMPVLCEFPENYLGLPKELLITVMKGHQKYFAVEGEDGGLRNYFIVISNTKDENAATIRTGAERVIKARFEDARFYYEEDIARPLQQRIEDLRRVTFHDRLGTLHDKTGRIVALASFLAGALCPDRKQRIERAAWLSKTDLITGVVGEFPELQGLMGRYYALNDGEDNSVAEAIMQQYLPAFSGDRLPETDEGAILSLSDKVDNIVSFFAIGLTPTGSEDPFALRRQALAVIAILMERNFDVTLERMIAKAQEKTLGTRPGLSSDIVAFFSQRMEPLLSARGYDPDVIQSVISFVGTVPLRDLKGRVAAVRDFTSTSEFAPFLLAMKRINNIIPDISLPAISKDLLHEVQEKILYSEVLNARPSILKLIEDRKYLEALRLSSTLTRFINAFFDGVLVMDKREDVKLNRFSLLKEIWTMTSSIADFSRLKETR